MPSGEGKTFIKKYVYFLHFPKEGRGSNPIHKVLMSFFYTISHAEVSSWVFKHGGGRGVKATFKKHKKMLHYTDGFPKFHRGEFATNRVTPFSFPMPTTVLDPKVYAAFTIKTIIYTILLSSVACCPPGWSQLWTKCFYLSPSTDSWQVQLSTLHFFLSSSLHIFTSSPLPTFICLSELICFLSKTLYKTLISNGRQTKKKIFSFRQCNVPTALTPPIPPLPPPSTPAGRL